MSEPNPFQELVVRIRAGDEAAATEFVRSYEGHVRRIVRIRLADPRLRRLVGSSDICQSVLASFFFRAAQGQYRLESPEQLLKLLATIARNKVTNEVNKQRRGRRDYRKQQALEAVVPGREETPSKQAALGELIERSQALFSAEERQLIALRQDGVEWVEIAAQMEGNAEALRKRLTRALDRVAEQLGID